MKKIEDFNSEKISLKKIFGGEIITTWSSEIKDKCTTTIQDSFDDVNGNGKRDGKESMSVCETTVCS